MVTPVSRRQNYSKTRAKASTESRHWRGRTGLLLSLIAVGIGVFGVMWGYAWVQKPTSFPIKQIHIQGQLTHETPVQIQKILQARLTGGFFSLNLSTVKQAVLTLPWIQDVSFRRVWPNALAIRIVEQQPVARFGKKGVLNSEGAVFYPDEKTIPASLPQFDGPADQAQALLNFYSGVSLLTKLLNLSIIEIKENAEHSWDIVLSNQVSVILGRDDVLPRFKRFVLAYPKIVQLSNRSISSVDLRYPNGVAVQYNS